MNETKTDEIRNENESAEEVKETKAPEEEIPAPSETELLKAEIEKLKGEIKEKDDRFLRMAAEYDNFRRRSREEKEATYDNAVADTVAELLPVFDNLERATQYDDGEKVKEGVVMVLKSADESLKKIGVSAFGAAGDTFDPKLHHAVMHTDDEEHGEGEIVEVFRKGYKKGDKIIRFAMVKSAN